MKQFVFESLNEFLSAQKEKFLKNAFPVISDEDFKKLSEADPSEKGIYTQWLLNLYSKGKLKLEDLYKATEYLTLFDTPKVKNKLSVKDINNYKSLSDLYKAIEPFKEKVSSGQLQSKSGILDQTFVKEFKNYNLYIPTTYEQSCQLGKGTEWCTATGKTREHWDYYSKQGDLYIFIPKFGSDKIQLHIQSRQLMDKYDEDINIEMFFDSNLDIKDWLNTEKDEAADIVLGKFDINLGVKGLTKLPEGLPKKCKGDFSCFINNLTSLEGAPEWVGGDFYCYSNKLTSLKGAPKYVGGRFYCYDNKLTSLKGAPEYVGGEFSCRKNPKLTSLEGAPKYVGRNFICNIDNTSLSKQEIERYEKTGAVKGKIIKG